MEGIHKNGNKINEMEVKFNAYWYSIYKNYMFIYSILYVLVVGSCRLFVCLLDTSCCLICYH
jgi:hypothetical protein